MTSTLELKVSINGEGTPIILVPGGLTGWQSWIPFVEVFTSMQRKVVRVQLINVEYGFENRPLPENYSVKYESEALSASINKLEFSSPLDIVGWSYGALVSLDYALDHPDKIRTLTLIEPPAIWVLREQGDLDEQTQGILKFFDTLHGDISDEMLADFLKTVGFTGSGQSPKDLPQWKQWFPFKQALRNSPAIVAHQDNLKRLQNFNRPVLLIKGTGSANFLHNIINILSANLPNSRVTEMAGGHAPHIVSRDKFLSELESFLNIPSKIKAYR